MHIFASSAHASCRNWRCELAVGLKAIWATFPHHQREGATIDGMFLQIFYVWMLKGHVCNVMLLNGYCDTVYGLTMSCFEILM